MNHTELNLESQNRREMRKFKKMAKPSILVQSLADMLNYKSKGDKSSERGTAMRNVGIYRAKSKIRSESETLTEQSEIRTSPRRTTFVTPQPHVGKSVMARAMQD